MKKLTFKILTKFFFLTFVVALAFSACGDSQNNDISPAPDYLTQYASAIEDAKIAETDEICSSLVKISLDNDSLQRTTFYGDSYVLTFTWTQYNSYCGHENETMALVWGKTWVSIPYEMKQFIADNHIDTSQKTLRYEQLLGLPYNSGKKWFVEMWVKPADLFRPSPDSEICDCKAEIDFSNDTPPSYQYVQWFVENKISSYYGQNKFPWTRLGYTYDWGNNNSEIGLSEFVIEKNAVVIIKSVAATLDYR
ncbi:MAG TPA: hypothetical protein PKY81_05985 [bacterium]|nr:hypothetical protein [bacterium]HPN30489.1 hypothetical protein [bacterium]